MYIARGVRNIIRHPLQTHITYKRKCPRFFEFELLCAFEFIDIHFTNFDDCQDYRSMARGSEKYVIASIAKTYKI